MAKVTAPLMSFGARGKLADTLVFFPWKGIDCVREYVIPTNPQTASQVAQRNRLEAAVDDWHDLGLDADDVEAWNRRATARPRTMSGFNAFCGEHVDIAVAGETPNMIRDGALNDDGDGTFSCSGWEDGNADAMSFFWGYSPTALINEQVLAEAPAGAWSFDEGTANSGRVVYGRFRARLAGNDVGFSGIFRRAIA